MIGSPYLQMQVQQKEIERKEPLCEIKGFTFKEEKFDELNECKIILGETISFLS